MVHRFSFLITIFVKNLVGMFFFFCIHIYRIGKTYKAGKYVFNKTNHIHKILHIKRMAQNASDAQLFVINIFQPFQPEIPSSFLFYMGPGV